jgi:hypothetical protein
MFNPKLPKTKKTHNPQTWKPKTQKNNFPHFQTLESNNGIPQNQGHSPRDATSRTQTHTKHAQIHSTRRLQRSRRICMQNSKNHHTSKRTNRIRI